uniref:Uncharacterized protein n=1 Tax=Molossus molossus TaxID=27622 RepID=A0A7J8DQ15_MOLMO|nr:hypothetical protein HJG59_009254 [Molossus molossus]
MTQLGGGANCNRGMCPEPGTLWSAADALTAEPYWPGACFFVFFIFFFKSSPEDIFCIFLQLEREGERERKRERNMDLRETHPLVASCTTPTRAGTQQQQRYPPLTQIEPRLSGSWAIAPTGEPNRRAKGYFFYCSF